MWRQLLSPSSLSRRFGVQRLVRSSSARVLSFPAVSNYERAFFDREIASQVRSLSSDAVDDAIYVDIEDDPPPSHVHVAGIGGGHDVEGIVVEHPDCPGQRLVWGKYAALAGASVLASTGNTQVLITVVSEKPKPGQPSKGFLPLTVEYKEKMAATGRIPSTFMRREIFSKNHEILAARAIDRSIRPLFRSDYRQDTQVICTVLSYDPEHDPVIVALNGVSACLHARSADFGWDEHGPVAAVRVGLRSSGEFVANPPLAIQRQLDMNALVVMRDNGRVVMLEGASRQIPESKFVEGIEFAQERLHTSLALQHELKKAVGVDDANVAAQSAAPRRWSFTKTDQETDTSSEGDNTSDLDVILGDVHEQIYSNAVAMCRVANRTKKQRAVAQTDFWANSHSLVATALADAGVEAPAGDGSPADKIHSILKKAIRDVAKGLHGTPVRPDGRALDEVRPLESELGILPSAHGSALFGRGDTQVICSATLGPVDDLQQAEKDSLLGVTAEPQAAMLHYEFLPYSTNSTGRTQMGFNRRAIGHSALAERSILMMLPQAPPAMALRLTSEVTSSDGSSSMATVCGASLAATHAGAPITAPVAGVAIGAYIEPDDEDSETKPVESGGMLDAMKSFFGVESSPPRREQDYTLLTDILGMEDHFGDMDFKITGSKAGLTACQLDVKAPGGIGNELIATALDKARVGRQEILGHMEQVLSDMPLDDPESQPAMFEMQLPEGNMDARRQLIGEAGSTIRRIEAETNARLTVSTDNKVIIFAQDKAQLDTAIREVEKTISSTQ